jgi:YidC/Oxa1 family membrane protein insertase
MTENWRMFVALILTIIVLIGWNFLMQPQGPENQGNRTAGQPTRQQQQAGTEAEERSSQRSREARPQETTPRQRQQPAEMQRRAAPEMADYRAEQGELITVQTPLYRAEINTRGGILAHFVLKKYRESIKKDARRVDLISPDALDKAPMGILWNYQPTWKKAEWTVERGGDMRLDGSQSGTLVLKGSYAGARFTRKLTFQADSYEIKEQLEVANTGQGPISGPVAMTTASKKLVEDASRFNQTNVIYFHNGLQQEDDTEELGTGIQSEAGVKWAGIASNYFLLTIVPTSEQLFFKGKYEDAIYRVALERNVTLEPGESSSVQATYYNGPKRKSRLAAAPNNLQEAIYYGWLDVISKPLVSVLNFFYNFAGNYGIAIILLTVVIKIIFWPLSQKSYKSMEKMKKIQPMMKELKEKYKDDRQKMNQELMRLYKTYKVNPAGGCLPMLLQIPVFIALYEALFTAIELRHAPFITHVPLTDIVWLADLSAKDPLYVTPVLMGLSMYLQQKLSPTAGDPTQAKIMMIMPVFLTFIFLNFPAGLVVYFITNNVLSIAQQSWMLRKA